MPRPRHPVVRTPASTPHPTPNPNPNANANPNPNPNPNLGSYATPEEAALRYARSTAAEEGGYPYPYPYP